MTAATALIVSPSCRHEAWKHGWGCFATNSNDASRQTAALAVVVVAELTTFLGISRPIRAMRVAPRTSCSSHGHGASKSFAVCDAALGCFVCRFNDHSGVSLLPQCQQLEGVPLGCAAQSAAVKGHYPRDFLYRRPVNA